LKTIEEAAKILPASSAGFKRSSQINRADTDAEVPFYEKVNLWICAKRMENNSYTLLSGNCGKMLITDLEFFK